jgi:hypothetical protein
MNLKLLKASATAIRFTSDLNPRPGGGRHRRRGG